MEASVLPWVLAISLMLAGLVGTVTKLAVAFTMLGVFAAAWYID